VCGNGVSEEREKRFIVVLSPNLSISIFICFCISLDLSFHIETIHILTSFLNVMSSFFDNSKNCVMAFNFSLLLCIVISFYLLHQE
jgi:hypothetical protein